MNNTSFNYKEKTAQINEAMKDVLSYLYVTIEFEGKQWRMSKAEFVELKKHEKIGPYIQSIDPYQKNRIILFKTTKTHD
jgi:hypothetical protein